jgi:hypothetical protein
VLPFRLLPIGPTTTLGDIYDRLIAALDRGDVEERSVYARGANGFALVARIESIENDGKAKSGQLRWQATPTHGRSFSLSEYIIRLFTAEPGRYRVIVLIVTGDPVVAGPKPPTARAMSELLGMGAGFLTERFRVLPASAARCEALIYEFFRSSAASPPKLVVQSSITPVQHLAGAGLWSRKDLRP